MEIVTVKELAEFLKVKPSTIYQWAEQGRLPCFKLNGALRFDKTEVIKHIRKLYKTY